MRNVKCKNKSKYTKWEIPNRRKQTTIITIKKSHVLAKISMYGAYKNRIVKKRKIKKKTDL